MEEDYYYDTDDDFRPKLDVEPLKIYITASGVKTVDGYPIEVGYRHSRTLIVLTVNKTNELCMEAAKAQSPSRRRRSSIVLTPEQQAVAREILQVAMTSQS